MLKQQSQMHITHIIKWKLEVRCRAIFVKGKTGYLARKAKSGISLAFLPLKIVFSFKKNCLWGNIGFYFCFTEIHRQIYQHDSKRELPGTVTYL